MRGAAFLALLLLASCGTYTLFRPADVLRPGHVEIGVGVAVNDIAEVNPVAHAAVGVLPRVELVGHYEMLNFFGEARLNLLSSEGQGFALTLGAGGGAAYVAVNDLDEMRPAIVTELSMGRRFGRLDLYLGARMFFLMPSYGVLASRLGVRIPLGAHLRLLVEGGAATHFDGDWGVALAIPEGSVGLAAVF